LGYYVLRYDFFGHGYSKHQGPSIWFEYTTDMLVDELEDLLDYIYDYYSKTKRLKRPPNIAAFIGHSTGGILGICASARWSTAAEINNQHPVRFIPRLILLSPAIWADKPLLAVLADQFPHSLTTLMKYVSGLKPLIVDAYFDVIKDSFAKDPQTNQYIHTHAEEELRLLTHRLFGAVPNVPEHPFIIGSILGLNCFTLRDDLLPQYRKKLIQILNDSSELSTPHVLFIWGDLDLVVPYKKQIQKAKKWTEEYSSKFELQEMKSMGHELMSEDPQSIIQVIQDYFIKTK